MICDGFSESQREMLATPTYRIRKDKKAGILVSPKDVKVISTVDTEPTFQSPSGAMAQVPAQPPSEIPPIASSSSVAPQPSYVTADQFTALSDKWAEQFARMEALLSRGNVFSTPVSTVKPMDTQSVISTTPFIPPATRPTSPVEVPVAVEDSTKPKMPDEKDKKKKSHKSRKHDKTVPDTQTKSSSQRSDSKAEKKRDRSESPVRKHSSAKGSSLTSKAVSSSGPESGKQSVIQKETSSLFSSTPGVVTTGTGKQSTSSVPPGHGQPTTRAFSPDTGFEHYDLLSENEDNDDRDRSGELSGSDEGQLSDSTETPEQTEEMSYRETVRSVRSYMGWHHIPAFETTFSEPDKSNNPWKGKNPRKPTHVSVAMPPDDWLCQKLERLNLTALEGYPSRSQDSAGLKKDQFIKVPKSQSKWCSMHLVKPDGPHRPGRSVFSWRNTEAKVNSQFPRLTRASAYPSTGPPSRPISQESLGESG